MADRGNRGDRGGRGGRGDRGDRGGGRGSRGGRGSSDKPFTPSTRGGDGRGRGSRGGPSDVSRGRGGRGGRGDSRGGRGEFRGGRGGGRGGRGGFYQPPPDADLGPAVKDNDHEKLENLRLRELHAANPDQLAEELKKVTLNTTSSASNTIPTQVLPLRPAFGTKGDPVLLWANYFAMSVRGTTLWKYAVKVEEQLKKAGKSGEKTREARGRKLYLVMQIVHKHFSEQTLVATEFKSQLVTLNPLTIEANPLEVRLLSETGKEDDADVFSVTIMTPNELPMGSLLEYLVSQVINPDMRGFPPFPECVDALNIIMGFKTRSTPDQITAVGSSRYFPFGSRLKEEMAFTPLGNQGRGRPFDALRGFFQSARLSTGRVLLNVNVTCGVFRTSGPMTGIFDDWEAGGITNNERDPRYRKRLTSLTKALSKARVRVTFRVSNGKTVERNKTVHDLVMSTELKKVKTPHPPRITGSFFFAGPKQVSFWFEENGSGRYVTVAEHFQNKYNMKLKDYPLLNLGGPNKPVFFPAEVVTLLPGQSVKAKLKQDETTKMLQLACQKPNTNATAILGAGRATLGLDSDVLTEWGISIGKELLVVQGRELMTPRIGYLSLDKKPSLMTPQRGSWNFKERLVARGATISKWACFQVKLWANAQILRDDEVKEFGGNLKNAGISLPQHTPHSFGDLNLGNVNGQRLEEVFQWAKKDNARFLLFVLSDKVDSSVYGRIKLLGDCTYGIHTSCVLAQNVRTKGPIYAANVALKWNLKAGGANHTLASDIRLLKEGKTMVVGYDVTHPTNTPVTEKNRPPSLVGMVASIAPDLAQWPATSWEQRTRQEMLDETLCEAFQSRLTLWQKHNSQKLPENIIIFRDGVSEGQFAQVLEKELPLMRKACQTIYKKGAQPNLTIVVSVKRHHTRFYPAEKDRADERTGNVKPGTVVDRGVTQTRFWDFYLTAHYALKGTARPAHYTVLLDEIFRKKFKTEAANEMEKVTHELCYLFGRATKAVSICPPAYYADIVCERARHHRPNYDGSDDTESVASFVSTGGSARIHPDLQDTMYYL